MRFINPYFRSSATLGKCKQCVCFQLRDTTLLIRRDDYGVSNGNNNANVPLANVAVAHRIAIFCRFDGLLQSSVLYRSLI